MYFSLIFLTQDWNERRQPRSFYASVSLNVIENMTFFNLRVRFWRRCGLSVWTLKFTKNIITGLRPLPDNNDSINLPFQTRKADREFLMVMSASQIMQIMRRKRENKIALFCTRKWPCHFQSQKRIPYLYWVFCGVLRKTRNKTWNWYVHSSCAQFFLIFAAKYRLFWNRRRRPWKMPLTDRCGLAFVWELYFWGVIKHRVRISSSQYAQELAFTVEAATHEYV